jgi:hypothetical protein
MVDCETFSSRDADWGHAARLVMASLVCHWHF